MTKEARPAKSPVRKKAAVWGDRYWTSHDGLNLYYRDYAGSAERPPLLCLHGLTRNSRDFETFAERYAGRFRVIVPDFRGRGMSEWDPLPMRYVPTTYAADVLQLLDELGIEQAVFVGTSLGGLVTMLIASIQPHRIVATILNDIGPEIDHAGLDRIGSYIGRSVRFQSWAELADTLAAVNRGLPASNSHGDWLRLARRVGKDDGDGIVFDYDMAIAAPFERSRGAVSFDMWPLYRQLGQTPLLILRGEHSDLLSVATAEAMLDATPDARLVTIPGVGHAPELNEPEALAAIDRLLLKELR